MVTWADTSPCFDATVRAECISKSEFKRVLYYTAQFRYTPLHYNLFSFATYTHTYVFYKYIYACTLVIPYITHITYINDSTNSF